ncbi:MAG: hypothetical protein P8L37_06315 [Phycisphaerales bacterium]|nr:hypothetical protein [Phycisphaerales bacterium]
MLNTPANEDQDPDGKALPPTEHPGSDDEAQTLDSSIQNAPSGGGSSVPDSQVSTILPLEENIETMEGVTALPRKSPERIASFRLIGVIGTGGMGKVYLAVQDRPRRHVAVNSRSMSWPNQPPVVSVGKISLLDPHSAQSVHVSISFAETPPSVWQTEGSVTTQ